MFICWEKPRRESLCQALLLFVFLLSDEADPRPPAQEPRTSPLANDTTKASDVCGNGIVANAGGQSPVGG